MPIDVITVNVTCLKALCIYMNIYIYTHIYDIYIFKYKYMYIQFLKAYNICICMHYIYM